MNRGCFAAAVTCPDPGQIANGRRNTNGPFNCDTRVTYSCTGGFNLQGLATITCQNNGQWSGSAPVCQTIGNFRIRNVFNIPSQITLADPRGRQGRPPGVQILSFSFSFLQKNGLAPPTLGVGAPPPSTGKSRIRHWNKKRDSNLPLNTTFAKFSVGR